MAEYNGKKIILSVSTEGGGGSAVYYYEATEYDDWFTQVPETIPSGGLEQYGDTSFCQTTYEGQRAVQEGDYVVMYSPNANSKGQHTVLALMKEIISADNCILQIVSFLGSGDGSGSGGGDNEAIDLIEGNLTEITSNATKLRNYAFYNWSTLTSVYFPQMTNITGQYAFQGTFNSMDITQDSFPMATEIGNYVFSSSKIKSANFPNVTTIGSGAFYNCTNLTNVDFAEALTTGNSVFGYCSKLVSVNLPKLTHLGATAFSSCSSLETIDLPEVVTLAYSTSGGVFQSCSKLKSVNLPKLQSLGISFFSSCTALTKVYLPQVTSQSQSAFSRCEKLETVILPKCTYIYKNSFDNCYSLKKLVLGTEATTNYVMSGSYNSFSNCYHILGTVNATYNPNGDKDGFIYVPLSRVEEVRTATNWIVHATQIMPWVATVEELANIDGTTYDHACVGEGVDSVEYYYNGTSWEVFRQL